MTDPITRYCRYEADQVPTSEIQVDAFWGLVHKPDDSPAHTIMGSLII